MARITTATPANYAFVSMPRVYNLQYPGDALAATASVAGATGYTVRDFTGTIVASGTWSGLSTIIGTAGTAPFNKFGWYSLQLSGTDRADAAFGTDYGTCRFVIAPTVSTCPTAPLRSTNPGYVSDGLVAPLAHGLFSLGGFRLSLLASRIAIRQIQDSAFLASGTTLTANLTGGGFGGATTAASDTFVAHTVVGDATGMANSSGYQTVATSTNGTVTLKVYRKFGAQSPGTITVTTTNAAQHTLALFEIQGLDDAAVNNGRLIAIPFTGSGTSLTMTADLTALAPGTTEYYIGSVVAADANVQATSTSGLQLQQLVQNQTLTHDSFGGGRAHSVTYTYATSHTYAGIIFAYQAVSTYAADLVNAKSQLTGIQSTWAQYATAARPRNISFQTLGGSANSLTPSNYSNAIKQTVLDTVNYVPNLIAGYTGRNEPQGQYNVAEAQAFSAAVHQVLGAKSLGPDYVSHPLDTDLAARAASGIFTYLDGFSFHCYNMNSGDLYGNLRPTLENLRSILVSNGVYSRPKYMTEGGHDTTWYPGNLRVHSAGQSFVMFNMASEILLGIPYENTNYYYDQRNGYDSVTTWSSSGSGPYPGWPLQRQFGNEVYGKTLESEISFGDAAFLYLGGVWVDSSGARVAAIIGASLGVPALAGFSRGPVTVVDAFGNVVATTTGATTLNVGSLPLYVRIPAGSSFGIRPPALGRNLLSAAYKPQSADTGESQATTSLLKMTDNSRVSCFAYSSGDATSTGPGSNYKTAVGTFPRTISVTTPLWNLASDTIVVTTGYPWQNISTPLDFDIQTLTGVTWTTRATFTQTPVSVKNFDVASDTMVDSYTNPQHVFVASVPAGTIVSGVQLVVRQGSFDMHMDALSNQPPTTTANYGPRSVSIRSVEAYNSLASQLLPLI